MISRETIDRIFEAVRIEEIIKDFVDLKKAGVNYKGRCPFHEEKTPSFVVSPSKGIYKCFGCGKGGNSVSFLQDLQAISYPEALRYIAEKYSARIFTIGIDLVLIDFVSKENYLLIEEGDSTKLQLGDDFSYDWQRHFSYWWHV